MAVLRSREGYPIGRCGQSGRYIRTIRGGQLRVTYNCRQPRIAHSASGGSGVNHGIDESRDSSQIASRTRNG